MAETSGFFDAIYNEETGEYDLEYLAEEFADYFSLFVGTGVFASPTNQLRVHAGEGLSVTVEPGWAFIEGYWYYNSEKRTLSIPPNDSTQSRTDCVKCRLDYANRKIHSLYFNNTTKVERNGNYYDLKLANVIVPVAASQILESNISDTRPNNSVCGFVKGLVEVVNTEDLFSQYQAIFETWFDEIKGSLGTDPATSLQSQIGSLASLQTSTKTNLVAAINSVNTALKTANTSISNLNTKVNKALFIVSFDPATGTLVTKSADYTG